MCVSLRVSGCCYCDLELERGEVTERDRRRVRHAAAGSARSSPSRRTPSSSSESAPFMIVTLSTVPLVVTQILHQHAIDGAGLRSDGGKRRIGAATASARAHVGRQELRRRGRARRRCRRACRRSVPPGVPPMVPPGVPPMVPPLHAVLLAVVLRLRLLLRLFLLRASRCGWTISGFGCTTIFGLTATFFFGAAPPPAGGGGGGRRRRRRRQERHLEQRRRQLLDVPERVGDADGDQRAVDAIDSAYHRRLRPRARRRLGLRPEGLERHRQLFPARAAGARFCHSFARSTACCQAAGSANSANDFCRQTSAR